jgi:hypothetical protein
MGVFVGGDEVVSSRWEETYDEETLTEDLRGGGEGSTLLEWQSPY